MKNYKILRITFVQLLLIGNLIANEEIFFLPYENKKALQNLIKKIELSKKEIYISTYIFTHKEIAKKLKDASKRDVKIKILFNEKTNLSDYSQIGNLAKIKNIECKLFNDNYSKMHANFITIDDSITIFGSLNLSKSAFKYNYEILYIKKDFNLTKKFKNYFVKIYSKSEFY